MPEWFERLDFSGKVSFIASVITILSSLYVVKYLFDVFMRPPVRRPRKKHSCTLVLCDTPDCVTNTCAQMFEDNVRDNPSSSFTLPTGRTGAKLFQKIALRTRSIHNFPSLNNCHFFIDTETFGVTSSHSASRQRFVRQHFLEALALPHHHMPKDENIHFLRGYMDETNVCEETNVLFRAYPPDIHFLAYSPNGEFIGYHPDQPYNLNAWLEDRAHIIYLSPHSMAYIDPNQPSRALLTIGLGNILDASRVIIPVVHPNKVKALKAILLGRLNTKYPISVIRLHRCVIIITVSSYVPQLYRKVFRYIFGYKVEYVGAMENV